MIDEDGVFLSQKSETIVYDWQEYNDAIKELQNIKDDKERLGKAVDYVKYRDLSDERYLYLFETARKISDVIDVEKIDTFSFFKRDEFISEVYHCVKDYFNISDDGLRFVKNFEPIWLKTHHGVYKDKSGKLIVYEPLWYTKYDMIFGAAVVLHEFWHYLQYRHPEDIEYKFTTDWLTFGKQKIKSKYKRILYRNKPLEQEGWFIGYALLYFLNKKTQFVYAGKKIKELMGRNDKAVIDVLKTKGKDWSV